MKRRPLRPGGRECECGVCRERFASATGFDAHRKAGACGIMGTARRLRRLGWTKDQQGRWLLPRKEDHDH